VPCHGGGREGRSAGRPVLEVADIFRVHGQEYLREHALSAEQQKVMAHILACRTEVLGGHLETCDQCGYQEQSYNSCGDRHCPKCQALVQSQWIEKRKERTLPTHYFHLVFTLPDQLRSLALCNRKVIFKMLFAAAAETLLELGRDPRHLGGLLGITAVLHTWTRQLDFHPHVHCIVTGGGLDEEGGRWARAKPDFLFPVKVLSSLFRGKFLAALHRAHERGQLEFAGGCADLAVGDNFTKLKDQLYRKDWVVYAKRPFGGPEHVFEYLGRYTHRVAISNYRLLAMDNDGVTFATKDGQTATLAPTEFIRRFLMHVLPKDFVKIRHYGLKAASNVNTKLKRAKEILEAELGTQVEGGDDLGDSWIEQMQVLTGVDLSVCPRCGTGRMIRSRIEHSSASRIPAEPQDTS
jgi:predicted Zn-ribbon and HTH transcriptional regulator